MFSVVVTEEDLARERALVAELAARDPGLREGLSTPADLEDLSVYHQVAERLPRYDAMLIHGSAVALDGQAYLFLAPSGTGKSTHARLWRERYGARVAMVNDDKPLLRFRADGVWACGTPWQGKHDLGGNMMAPLRAAVLLSRAAENRIERVTAAEAYPALLQQCYVFQSPEGAARMLRLTERLAAEVPVFRLGCDMSPEAARVAREGIRRAIG